MRVTTVMVHPMDMARTVGMDMVRMEATEMEAAIKGKQRTHSPVCRRIWRSRLLLMASLHQDRHRQACRRCRCLWAIRLQCRLSSKDTEDHHRLRKDSEMATGTGVREGTEEAMIEMAATIDVHLKAAMAEEATQGTTIGLAALAVATPALEGTKTVGEVEGATRCLHP